MQSNDKTNLDTASRRMAAFTALTQDEQRRAIRNLSAAGMSDHGIARATGLSVEQICRVLAASASDSTPQHRGRQQHGNG
jgi:ABC-type phosphate/phosphonate transport system ATPase subunit